MYLAGFSSSTVNQFKSAIYVSSAYAKNGELFAGSDIKLKENITPISNQFISELFGMDNITYEFDWKGSGKHSAGMIAQWIKEYMPETVDYNKDLQLYSVNYNAALSKLVGALFKKIKQQDIIINDILNKLNK